jgi:hypothetical protein
LSSYIAPRLSDSARVACSVSLRYPGYSRLSWLLVLHNKHAYALQYQQSILLNVLWGPTAIMRSPTIDARIKEMYDKRRRVVDVLCGMVELPNSGSAT